MSLAQRAFVSHGVAIGVRTNEPTLLDRVPACFPPGWEDSPSSVVDTWYSIVRAPVEGGRRVRYQLFEDEVKLEEGFRMTRLLDSMDSAIRLQVGRRAPERLFVHAGAVAWKNRAIIIPGRSGVGKTTLVASLLAAGATYYSDEYAVLDGRGLLHPYPRPLSFRHGENRRLRQCAVADLGGRHATEPLPLGLVLHTRYRTGAQWEPRTLTPGEGVLALFDNVLAARERPSLSFSVLSRAVSSAVILAGDRGEAAAAASTILDYFDRLHSITKETIS